MGSDEDLDGSAMELVRRRMHKVSDMVQIHEGKLGEHGVLIGVLSAQVEALRSTTASREQLDHGLKLMTEKMGGIERTTADKMDSIEQSTATKIENAESTLTLKLENMHNDMAPIKSGIYKIVWLIVAAVVVAILALVIKG